MAQGSQKRGAPRSGATRLPGSRSHHSNGQQVHTIGITIGVTTLGLEYHRDRGHQTE
ncbi:unnamed protein product [Amoebophrya sp. A25]|nr:unnamed protein product [Amoebophrya sp. A25]|eukprot:GSA25T00020950001.1